MRTPISATGEPSARGFTIVELLVVVAILAVAAGLIIPRMHRPLEVRELREAAARFAHTARTVQELAVARQQEVSIDVDLDHRTYAVIISDDKGAGDRVPLRTSYLKPTQLAETLKLRYENPEGTVSATGVEELKFFPDGTSSGASISLSGKSETCRIIVHPHNWHVVLGNAETTADDSDRFDLGD